MQSHNYREEKKEEAWKWNSYSCSTGRMHKKGPKHIKAIAACCSQSTTELSNFNLHHTKIQIMLAFYLHKLSSNQQYTHPLKDGYLLFSSFLS